MNQNGSEHPRRPPLRLVSSDPREEFFQTFAGNRSFQEACHRILEHYGNRHEGSKLQGLLLNSGVLHPQVMIPGLEKLAEVLRLSATDSNQSYRDWLVRKIYEKVYFENRPPAALGELIRSLHFNDPVLLVERRLASHFPELDLRFRRDQGKVVNSFQQQIEIAKQDSEWRSFERVSSILPLNPESRWVVFHWKRHALENHLGNLQVRVEPFLDRFYEVGEGPGAARIPEINRVIAEAGESPMGVARLSRLNALLWESLNPAEGRLVELR